jgi:adenylate cyclase
MDVRDFTPISEGLSAQELVEFVNQLLSPLTEIIQAELGTVDKYMGDAIMAFWNAPLDIADHPVRACRAALKMREAVARLNAEDAFRFRQREAGKHNVKIGIGVNTGQACVGNMGSKRRFNYSAMGDVVNVTSRIESSCKLLGYDIIVSGETAAHVADFAMLEAGDYTLKGKSQALKLFALLGDENMAKSVEFCELRRRHDQLLAVLRTDNGPAITAALEKCRLAGGDGLRQFYDRFEEIADQAEATHRMPRGVAL